MPERYKLLKDIEDELRTLSKLKQRILPFDKWSLLLNKKGIYLEGKIYQMEI